MIQQLQLFLRGRNLTWVNKVNPEALRPRGNRSYKCVHNGYRMTWDGHSYSNCDIVSAFVPCFQCCSHSKGLDAFLLTIGNVFFSGSLNFTKHLLEQSVPALVLVEGLIWIHWICILLDLWIIFILHHYKLLTYISYNIIY